MTSIARFSLVAFDCPDAMDLARFYAAITGWDIDPDSDEEWVELRGDGGATIACQTIEGYEEPTWPGGERPQQAHLDFDVDDLDRGEEQVLAIGARKAEVQPKPESWRVYLDPVGHPFCLVRASSP